MEWFIFWFIVNCIVGYLIGQQKNCVAAAIVLSILLGPIGWLIAALSSGNLRKCPFCAEHVKPEATVCRHCGKDLPPAEKRPVVPVRSEPEEELRPAVPLTKGQKIVGASILAAIVLAIVIAAVVGSSNEVVHPARHDGVAAATAPVETPQQISYPSLTLTKSVALKDSVGRVIATLPAGQSVQYAYHTDYTARIFSAGRDYEIPISSTNLK